MRVRSALANMEVIIGSVSRRDGDLILQSAEGGALDTEIAVSAPEALKILGRILATPAGLRFVLGLPFCWLRRAPVRESAPTAAQANINKPW